MKSEPYASPEDDPSLDAFAAELAGLRPHDDRAAALRTAYLAGHAAAVAELGRVSRIGRWGWPASFGGMTIAAGILLALVLRATPTPVPKLGDAPANSYATSPSGPTNIASSPDTVTNGDNPVVDLRKLRAGMSLEQFETAIRVSQTDLGGTHEAPTEPTRPLTIREFQTVL
ncbi:MAG: hypothetical protein QM811_04305 [Pirellulales bacterium]